VWLADDARQREQTDHDRHQQGDHQAENVEEMGILLAHAIPLRTRRFGRGV